MKMYTPNICRNCANVPIMMPGMSAACQRTLVFGMPQYISVKMSHIAIHGVSLKKNSVRALMSMKNFASAAVVLNKILTPDDTIMMTGTESRIMM